MRVLLGGFATCVLLSIGFLAGCGSSDSKDPTPPPSESEDPPATPANLVETTIAALKSASLLTDEQATALRTAVDVEVAGMTLLSTTSWNKSAFAFSKHVPDGVALEKYIAIVWSKGTEAAGGESKKEESLISMLKQSSEPWLENETKLKLIGAGVVAHLGIDSGNFSSEALAPRILASLLTTSDARFEKISSGFASAIMKGQNQFATVDTALATVSKAITLKLAGIVVDGEITDTGVRGGQVIGAMFEAMSDATDPNGTVGLLDVATGIGRSILAGMLPGLSTNEQKSLAEEVPSTALIKASSGTSGLGFSNDYVVRILNKEMVAGLADAEKSSPSTIDFDVLLVAISAKMPVADFFSVTDPGNCGGVSQLVQSAGRGLIEGGDPEGNAISYAKSFSFAFAEFIKNAGVCSVTVSDWDNARNPLKELFTDSSRAIAFENAMNSIAPSAFDSTNGVVNGTTPCAANKVAFDVTFTEAPFTNGKFVCTP